MRAGPTAALRGLGAALALAIASPHAAHAERVSYRLRWFPPKQGIVTGYRVYVGTASMSYAAPVEIGFVTPGPDGVASAVVPGFESTSESFAVMTAVGPGGESVFSNEIAIAATQCAMSCDDGNPCTADRCSAGSCASEPRPNGSACDDGNAATASSICSAGQCVAVPAAPTPPPPPIGERCSVAADCQPRGPCELAVCDAALGCIAQAAPAGSACDDGDATTRDDVCAKGVCSGQPQCSSRGNPRALRLGWTADPAHYMTIQWDAPKRSVGRVRYRHPDGEWTVAEAQPGEVEVAGCEGRYAVELSQLEAASEYEYQIQSDGETGPYWSVPRSFRTADDPGGFFGLYTTAFIASMGRDGSPASPNAARVLQALASGLRPDLVLGGGGYAYASDGAPPGQGPTAAIESWLEQLTPLASHAPFLPVYGETDVAEDLGYYRRRVAAFDRHAHAPGSYSFDVGRTHYAALHAPSPAALDAPALLWLDLDLASARQHGAEFLVVYMHTDPYSSHPAAGMSPQVRDALQEVLDRHEVNLVLSGDTPGLERSHPIRAGTPHPSSELFIENSAGVVYLRAGSGGRDDQLSWNPPAEPPAWLGFRESRLKSFVVLFAVGHSLFVQSWGVPDEGDLVLLDRFALSSHE